MSCPVAAAAVAPASGSLTAATLTAVPWCAPLLLLLALLLSDGGYAHRCVLVCTSQRGWVFAATLTAAPWCAPLSVCVTTKTRHLDRLGQLRPLSLWLRDRGYAHRCALVCTSSAPCGSCPAPCSPAVGWRE